MANAMRFCEQCSQTLGPDAAKCPNCGATVIRAPAKPLSAIKPAFVIWGLVALAACATAYKIISSLAAFDSVAYGPLMLPVQAMIVVACGVCALMGETKRGPAPAAVKAAPVAAPAPSFTPAQRKEMDRLMLMNRVGIAGFIGALAAAGCGIYSANGSGRFVILSMVALAPCVLVNIVALYGIRSFVCPGCGGLFSVPLTPSRRTRNDGRHCVHCGFDAYAPDPGNC